MDYIKPMSRTDDWKYHITITERDYSPVQDWCNEYIGEFDVDWYRFGMDPLMWLNGDYRSTWCFKDEQKAIHFKLRWS